MAPVLDRRGDAFKQKRIIYKLEQVLYLLVIVPLVAFLPAPLAYGIACLQGDWVYRHNKVARERIMCNLTGVFGEQLSPAECARMTRDFFRRRSCESMDMMRLAGRGRALARLVEIRGLEHIESALAAGKGAILCSAHFGFFYGSFSLLGAYGFPITVVGNRKSASDPMPLLERLFWRLSVERRLLRHRRRSNIEPHVGQVETAMRIVEILRSDELIAMAIDVSVSAEDRARAVPVDFLGRQALLLPGSIEIAQITNSPVLALIVHRSGDWRHQVLEISPVPLNGDTVTDFKRCVSLLEAPISENPAFWDGWGNVQELVDLGLQPTH